MHGGINTAISYLLRGSSVLDSRVTSVP